MNVPEGVCCVINGDYKVGEIMTNDNRVPLISATGSTRMGKIVGQEVAARLGRSLSWNWVATMPSSLRLMPISTSC
jgi:aldehyde dehydrogenase (NAD+)